MPFLLLAALLVPARSTRAEPPNPPPLEEALPAGSEPSDAAAREAESADESAVEDMDESAAEDMDAAPEIALPAPLNTWLLPVTGSLLHAAGVAMIFGALMDHSCSELTIDWTPGCTPDQAALTAGLSGGAALGAIGLTLLVLGVYGSSSSEHPAAVARVGFSPRANGASFWVGAAF
jgi:hypothetical protein